MVIFEKRGVRSKGQIRGRKSMHVRINAVWELCAVKPFVSNYVRGVEINNCLVNGRTENQKH